MGNYTIYHLKFQDTQLHTGRDTGSAQVGSLGLEKTETYIPADTLFSAICQTWTTFYDEQSLTTFLKGYTDNSQQLPFMLTSAFPYASDVYLYPRPLTWYEKTKESKRVRFVSQSIFQGIISNNPPNFCKDHLINGGAVWVSSAEKDQLKTLYCNDEDDEVAIWETNIQPRVTMGSRNAGSEIWHVETVQFNDNCGLWFAAKFDTDETKEKIETLLRVLGDTGIGGERNAGYGLFEIDPNNNTSLPNIENTNRFVTLSRICPKSTEQLEQLRIGRVAYTLNRVNAPDTSARKQVYMFAEGSVLNASEKQIGQLVKLQHKNSLHPVYRYGYAWKVGIKGASQ